MESLGKAKLLIYPNTATKFGAIVGAYSQNPERS